MTLPNIRIKKEELSNFSEAIQKEWLITNGLGGYASSTVLGVNTRKYHGLLVAAFHPPGDRTVCLAKLDEEVTVNNEVFRLGTNEFKDVFYPEGFRLLEEFSISPFPQYKYYAAQVTVSKKIVMPHEKNLAVTIYNIHNEGRYDVLIRIAPLLSCRHFHKVVNKSNYGFKIAKNPNTSNEVDITSENPNATITLRTTSGIFKENVNWVERLFHREEALRGESSIDDCYQPGAFEITVRSNSQMEFAVLAAASTNSEENTQNLNAVGSSPAELLSVINEETQRQEKLLSTSNSLSPTLFKKDILNWLLLAADSFIVRGPNSGKSVIAGYHWFEAWGRDTFVSLPGLMLVTGKFEEARKILFGFNKFCMQGLIPNFLSDLSLLPSCNTVDATMWHVNAVLQYLKYTGDFNFVKEHLWASLQDIAESHIKGTGFGIHMDHDGLLAHGPRLTWMDAEVDGNAVTPRAGKAVEIQALWYNALKTMQLLADRFAERNLSETYGSLADKVEKSFNEKFWHKEGCCLFDVIGEYGADSSLRPNQIIAASLDFTMLTKEKSKTIVNLAEKELLTPCGLRTLAKGDPRYRGAYFGDRRNRDQAYHNGTVWPWLLGPFITAYLKTRDHNVQSLEYAFENFLEPLFRRQIDQACLGTINEVYDGDQPHTPRGCVSQAWSVAEPIRAYFEDILLLRPNHEKEVLSLKER